MFMLCMSFAYALPLCEEPISAEEECFFITPELSCSTYDYKIFNSTDDVVVFDNLTIFNGSVYKFNFSQNTGDYLILLCDGTTREVIVGGKDSMLAIIIGIGILVGMIFYFAFKLDNKHELLRMILIFSAFSLLLIIPRVLINYDSGLAFYKLYVWVYRVFWIYVGVYFFYFVMVKFGLIVTKKKKGVKQ